MTAYRTSFRCQRGTCLLRSRRLCASLLAMTALSSVAHAQVAQLRPTVTRAVDLIGDYPTRVPVGTDVIFSRRVSDASTVLVRSGIQVRVFSLRDQERRPVRIATVGDCDVYLSVVHILGSEPDGRLRFVKMDPGWVNLTNSERSTKDGRWLLVFEQIGAPQAQFRIKTKDASAYFDTGFVVTVYDNGTVPFSLIREEYERRRGESARLYEEVDQIDARVPCYSYKRVEVASEAGAPFAFRDIEPCNDSRAVVTEWSPTAMSD